MLAYEEAIGQTLTAHYRQAKTIVRRIEELKRISDEIEQLVEQKRLPERCTFALVDATRGYRIRNSTYRKISEISENLASRDLKLLVDQGLLVPIGETKNRAYGASPVLVEIQKRTRLQKRIEDPFGAEVGQALLPGLVESH